MAAMNQFWGRLPAGNRANWFLQPEKLAYFACAFSALGLLTARAQGQATEVVLHEFATHGKPAHPYGGLVQDAAGNLYGTTADGGKGGHGAVYRLDKAGREKVLYEFKDGTDGARPYAGVVLDATGNLYGTTYYGGASQLGVVYKLDPSGRETVLHDFAGGADGAGPYGGVVLDSAGNLYGTTYAGGAADKGTVYKLGATGQEAVLYSFGGIPDGAHPYAGITLDAAGNLYGTTYSGGVAGAGAVYEINPAVGETIIYSFTGSDDGGHPFAGVVLDESGNLYGTAYDGGPSNMGVVYKITGPGQQVVLYGFTRSPGWGPPRAGVILDSEGNLYGTTAGKDAGEGSVYRLDPTGQATALHIFNGSDGGDPFAGVILDEAGNVYGTTYSGGAAEKGVVYMLDATGVETPLYEFGGGAGGAIPAAGVSLDAAGNLYGTTTAGGTRGFGVVYKMDAAGHETVLHSFAGGADGMQPFAGVILDAIGNLYGTTAYGGPANAGVVYKLDATGQETVLYSFTGGTDGANPMEGLTLDASGGLYGTTYYGGEANVGVVYKVDPAGSETVLYSFTGGMDGANPSSPVVLDAEGNVYGTTLYGGITNSAFPNGCGVLYEVAATGHESTLYTFKGPANGMNDGASPSGDLVLDAAGNLYGTTYTGGTYYNYRGMVYKVDPAGQETVLHSFTGSLDDGFYPLTGLMMDASGNLYGTTSLGGPADLGTVYQVNPAGQETVLYSFTEVRTSGADPSGVALDAAGNLYGAAFGGGKGGGLVFKLAGAAPAARR